jgi:hypothetical protein
MARGLATLLAVLVLGVSSGPKAAGLLLREFSVWRIDAKVAQRAHLDQARFAEEPRLAQTAAARAEALAAECRTMILS